MADPVTLPQVLAELRSKDLEQVQSGLALAIEYEDAPEIADALLALLGSLSPADGRDGYVLGQVVGLLGALDERRALPRILALVASDVGSFEDDQLLEQLCTACVQLRAIEALPALRTGFAAWRYHETTVADAIVELGGAAEIDFFTTALGARVQAVKLAALGALVTLNARGAVARIEKLRTSKDADVREAALAALVQLAPERAPELLDAVFAAADLPDGNKMDAVKLGNPVGLGRARTPRSARRSGVVR
jgi:HEAT repeat protein